MREVNKLPSVLASLAFVWHVIFMLRSLGDEQMGGSVVWAIVRAVIAWEAFVPKRFGATGIDPNLESAPWCTRGDPEFRHGTASWCAS